MSERPSEHVVVTGATGYIGARVLARLDAAGVRWTALSRAPPASSLGRHVPFELGQPLEELWHEFPRFDAILHLAASTATEPAQREAEVATVRALLRLASERGARFVFASSQTASADAPTGYGRLKWRLEQLVAEGGGVSARIGLVYGGPERGLFGDLCAIARRSPLLPAFLPDPPVQPIHVDDLAQALIELALSAGSSGPCCEVASPQPIGFSRFMRALARFRVRRLRLFVPLPTALVTLLNWVAGRAAPSGLARLESLFRLPPLALAADHLAQLGTRLRPLQDGLARSGDLRRRERVREGWCLLRQLTGRAPATLVKRYVRALERAGLSAAMDQREEGRRVLLAARVLEASPLGAELMMAREPDGLLGLPLRLARALVADGAAHLGRRLRRRPKREAGHGR